MKGKRILLGITGGIAAYKIASLIRLFIQEEAEVRCIMTPASSDFISPLTIATLCQHPVYIDFWNKSNGEWTNHVSLGGWADVFLIAPLTANTLAKLANGYCDNLLTATYLSSKTQVIVSPAMDLDMYQHATTHENLSKLSAQGVIVLPAEEGFLASGLIGKGRLPEPTVLFSKIQNYFNIQATFDGQTVLITAGPTYEHIDPVRFIGNHSSGKMGFLIASSFLKRGAKVKLISGPTHQKLEHPNLEFFPITTALEMLEVVKNEWSKSSIGVFSAAVADYRPVHVADQKIKKNTDELTLTLVKNPDILAWAGANKNQEQFLVGFALETTDGKAYAEGKIKSKKLDAIVLNSLEVKGAGFGCDTNQVSICTKDLHWNSYELKSKVEVAEDIVEFIQNTLELS
jgi:phosphopantothenoylcysteine decarboxylase/phosphopantothenate--cysteine ligase